MQNSYYCLSLRRLRWQTILSHYPIDLAPMSRPYCTEGFAKRCAAHVEARRAFSSLRAHLGLRRAELAGLGALALPDVHEVVRDVLDRRVPRHLDRGRSASRTEIVRACLREIPFLRDLVVFESPYSSRSHRPI